jgi:hypothetical protein
MFQGALRVWSCAFELTFARPCAMNAAGSTERLFYLQPRLQSTTEILESKQNSCTLPAIFLRLFVLKAHRSVVVDRLNRPSFRL